MLTAQPISQSENVAEAEICATCFNPVDINLHYIVRCMYLHGARRRTGVVKDPRAVVVEDALVALVIAIDPGMVLQGRGLRDHGGAT